MRGYSTYMARGSIDASRIYQCSWFLPCVFSNYVRCHSTKTTRRDFKQLPRFGVATTFQDLPVCLATLWPWSPTLSQLHHHRHYISPIDFSLSLLSRSDKKTKSHVFHSGAPRPQCLRNILFAPYLLTFSYQGIHLGINIKINSTKKSNILFACLAKQPQSFDSRNIGWKV